MNTDEHGWAFGFFVVVYRWFSQHDPFPFEFWPFEIQNQTDLHILIDDIEARLLPARYAPQSKLNHKGILVRLFQKSMPKRIEHLHGAADDLARLLFINQSVSICVHWWFSQHDPFPPWFPDHG
jgi:hypothetical protein